MLTRVFLIYLAVILLSSLLSWLFFRYATGKKRLPRWMIGVQAFFALELAALCWIALLDDFSLTNQGLRMMVLTFITYFNGILLSFFPLGFPAAYFKKHEKPFASNFSYGLATLMLVLTATYFEVGLLVGYKAFELNDYTYSDERVPPGFDGYRIALVSDMHLGTLHGDTVTVERMVTAINMAEADLIAFVGDAVNHQSCEFSEFVGKMSRLRAKDGVVSVLGNHDYGGYLPYPDSASQRADLERLVREEQRAGWRVLRNENLVIRRGSDSLVVVGSENYGKPPHPAEGRLDVALSSVKPDAFCLLLTHDPYHWDHGVVGKTNIPLTLSGHTHGLQLDLWRGALANLVLKRGAGAFTEGRQTLYVTTGIGTSLIPMRTGVAPEVVVVTLRNPSAAKAKGREEAPRKPAKKFVPMDDRTRVVLETLTDHN